MKLQNKIAGIVFLFGLVVLLPLLLLNNVRSVEVVTEKESHHLENIAKNLGMYMGTQLAEKAETALTISSAPILHDALKKSNAAFAALDEPARSEKVETLNTRWKKERSDPQSTFVQNHMTNPAAKFLERQQQLIPDMYGEIFLTNRYGAMIATTGRLSTLAHSHKYWWQASFHGGDGRIFFDDRGFDESVSGYVLGVVIPVKENGEIIGILKCNVNIMGPLTNILNEYEKENHGLLQIVRTQGLIIAQKGVEPLAESVGHDIAPYLQSKDTGSAIVGKDLIAYASIPITTGSALYGFGGSYASIDHIKGNRGEAWHIVISYKLEQALSVAKETTNLLLAATVIFILITIATALYIGRWVAKPVEKLSDLAEKIGDGDLAVRAEVLSQDEVGTLAATLNTMAENLQTSNEKREELLAEIQENNDALTVANDKLQELDLLKTMFIASMSHELRTPLNAIIGFSSILEKEMLGELNEQQKDKVSRIHTSGQRLLDLIVDVIDISKIEAGEIELKPDNFALGELFDEAVVNVRNEADDKGIAIEYDSTPDTTITCDRERLLQAVQNYLSNAIKFSEAGTITLLSKVRENDLHIEVIDTGIGIEEKDIPKLFKAFERIDSHLSVKAGGAGIGLYLTKKIVEELLGGSVYVYSQKDTGSTFGITLPLVSQTTS